MKKLIIYLLISILLVQITNAVSPQEYIWSKFDGNVNQIGTNTNLWNNITAGNGWAEVTTGKIGQALRIEGTGYGIYINATRQKLLLGSSNGTITFWFNITTDGNQYITETNDNPLAIGANQAWVLQHSTNAGNDLYWQIGGGSGATTRINGVAQKTGQWWFAAGTWARNSSKPTESIITMHLWNEDGTSYNITTSDTTVYNNEGDTDYIQFGYRGSAGLDPKFIVDDFRMYTTNLSITQLKLIYNNSKGTPYNLSDLEGEGGSTPCTPSSGGLSKKESYETDKLPVNPNFNWGANYWYAQSFIANETTNITQVSLKIGSLNADPRLKNVSIYSNNGADDDPNLPLSTNNSITQYLVVGWNNFTIPRIEVTNGTRYHIVVRTGIGEGGADHFWAGSTTNPNNYTKGQLHYDADGAPGSWSGIDYVWAFQTWSTEDAIVCPYIGINVTLINITSPTNNTQTNNNSQLIIFQYNATVNATATLFVNGIKNQSKTINASIGIYTNNFTLDFGWRTETWFNYTIKINQTTNEGQNMTSSPISQYVDNYEPDLTWTVPYNDNTWYIVNNTVADTIILTNITNIENGLVYSRNMTIIRKDGTVFFTKQNITPSNTSFEENIAISGLDGIANVSLTLCDGAIAPLNCIKEQKRINVITIQKVFEKPLQIEEYSNIFVYMNYSYLNDSTNNYTSSTFSYEGVSDDGILVSTNYSGNRIVYRVEYPITIPLMAAGESRVKNISFRTVTTTDLGQSVDTIHSGYNLTIIPNLLEINFSENTSGLIQDFLEINNKSFTEKQLIIERANLTDGYNRVLFGDDVNNTKAQKFEFYNDGFTTTSVNLMVINADTGMLVKVLNEEGDGVIGAEVRIYQQNGVGTNSKQLTNTLFSIEGGSVDRMWLDSTKQAWIEIEMSGYYVYKKVFQPDDFDNYATTPLEVRLKKAETIQSGRLFVYQAGQFVNRTRNMSVVVEYQQGLTLTYNTPFAESVGIANRTILCTEWLNVLNCRRRIITLRPDIDFNSTGTDDINLTIYETLTDTSNIFTRFGYQSIISQENSTASILVRTLSDYKNQILEDNIIQIKHSFRIKYWNQPNMTHILPLSYLDETQSHFLAIIILVTLILISCIIGFLTINPDTGFHTFMIGTIVISVLTSQLWYMTYFVMIYYLTTLLRKFVKEEN